jgi:hypothetical protein
MKKSETSVAFTTAIDVARCHGDDGEHEERAARREQRRIRDEVPDERMGLAVRVVVGVLGV